jgi:predicted HD phosphohydrolase
MDAAEVAAFERRPDRGDLVALRRADDAAKVRGKDVDPLESWLPVVTGMCRTRST